jgi:RNA binding exosome subunit
MPLIGNSGAVLPSRIPIGYIDIRVFAHATEDVDKVLNAVRNIFPSELIDIVAFRKSSLAGHHGNPIILFEARIKEKSAAQAVFEKLSLGLSMLDKEQLNNEIVQHLDKGNLYIRLDKQSAFLNELKLSSADPIHFRIHFKKHAQEEIMDICRKSGLLP